MSLRDFAERREGDVLRFKPDRLMPDPGLNVRNFESKEVAEHVAGLVESIREKGILEVLSIRLPEDETHLKKKIAYITNGECRWRAAMILAEEGKEILLPCRNEEHHANDSDRVVNMLLRNTGRALTPLEQGLGFKKLLAYGMLQTEIAKKLGCTPGHVSHVMQLMSAPQEIQEIVKAGDVSATVAVTTIREEGAKAVKVLSRAVALAKKGGKKKATSRTVKAVQNRPQFTSSEVDDILKTLEFVHTVAETIKEARQEVADLLKRLSHVDAKAA